jgi:hypothetical protein
VSLHTIVIDGLVGRLPHRPAAATVADDRGGLRVRLTGMSMRFLETALAVTAIATALLIGQGR